MDALGNVANILQIVTSIGFFVAAYKWGRQMLKKYPAGYWALIIIAGLTVLVSAASFADKQGWIPTRKPEQIFNRHFKNEDVVLDNKEFFNCVFEGVNFKYGGGYYRLENVNIVPPMRITTTDLLVSRGIYFIQTLGLLDKTKIPGFIPTPPDK